MLAKVEKMDEKGKLQPGALACYGGAWDATLDGGNAAKCVPLGGRCGCLQSFIVL